MKKDYPLYLEKSSGVRDHHVQVAISGTEVVIGEIHKDHVDDIINAVNSTKASTKVPSDFILSREQLIRDSQ